MDKLHADLNLIPELKWLQGKELLNNSEIQGAFFCLF